MASERTKVLEAFLQEDEEKSKRLKLSGENEEDEIQPIGYDVHKPTTPAKKERIGDTSANKKVEHFLLLFSYLPYNKLVKKVHVHLFEDIVSLSNTP